MFAVIRPLTMLLAGLLGIAAIADAGPSGRNHSNSPPALIDREVLFADAITQTRISPDGRFMSFAKPWKGVTNVWILPVGQPFEQAWPLTTKDRPVSDHFWSQDSDHLIIVVDQDGDENFKLLAVDPERRPESEADQGHARILAGEGTASARLIAVPNDNANHILIGLNERDPTRHDVYRLSLDSGQRELLIRNEHSIIGWLADQDGRLRLARRHSDDGGTEILSVADNQVSHPVYRCGPHETCRPLRILPDGRRVWMLSNRVEDRDLIGLELLDLESGEVRVFEHDPAREADLARVLFEPTSARPLATLYDSDQPRMYPQTDGFASELAWLRERLPEGQLDLVSQSADGRRALVVRSLDADPGTLLLLDRDQQTLDKVVELRPRIPLEAMASTQVVRYPTRDGLDITAYLTLPMGADPERLPLVALIHGGPWSRDRWGFQPEVQFLANRGYAVFQPNFRGSTGFGKAFLNAGDREWGDAMQNDITDGIERLVERGIVDPGRVCIMGASYGGYAALAGLAFTPDTYTCGISIVGVFDLVGLVEQLPALWQPYRQTFIRRLGDPERPADRARLKRQSPIHHVYAIDSPVLIAHGAHDPRVQRSQSDRMVAAMHQAGRQVEYLLAEDEGHGFRQRHNRLALYARIEHFLAEHLGGRFQPWQEHGLDEHLEAMTVVIDRLEQAARDSR